MALTAKEAEERIRIMEDRCARELRATLEQQAQLEEERRMLDVERSRAVSPLPDDEHHHHHHHRKRHSNVHSVWGQGPSLNTADRALAWDQWQKHKEHQRNSPPSEAWSKSLQSANAFRMARRFPLPLPASGNTPRASQGIVGGQRLPTPGALRGSSSTGTLQGAAAALQSGALQHGTLIEPITAGAPPVTRATVKILPEGSSTEHDA